MFARQRAAQPGGAAQGHQVGGGAAEGGAADRAAHRLRVLLSRRVRGEPASTTTVQEYAILVAPFQTPLTRLKFDHACLYPDVLS